MLNPALYEALRRTFGEEPEIGNDGIEAVFSCPPIKRTRLGRKTKRYAVVEHWGEIYILNCPLCGDTRHRLYFSHLFGSSTKMNTVTYYFGRLYKCQNEGCNLGRQLDRMTIDESVVVKTKPRAYTGIMLQTSELPKGCLPLMNTDVPQRVMDYLYQRKFPPEELAHEYFVHYAPKGATYQFREETRKFFDERLIIPVIQGRRLVGWQGRRCQDIPKDKYKYLNSDIKKSSCLYNRDIAMFHRDIVVVEGVTDCWRIGPESVALFGKDASTSQIELMKTLWGFSGSAVICFDTDDPKAKLKQTRLIDRLRREKIFPRGVAALELPPGVDPAVLSREDIRARIAEARQQCS